MTQELFVRESGLFDDGFQSPPLEIAIVEWNGDAQSGVAGMLEDVVAAADVVDEKTSPLQCPEHRARLEGRQSHCHLGGNWDPKFFLDRIEDEFLIDGDRQPVFL